MNDWPPPPPSHLWVVLVGAIWCAFMIRLGEWIAIGWP
jgi:hypothetical protein